MRGRVTPEQLVLLQLVDAFLSEQQQQQQQGDGGRVIQMGSHAWLYCTSLLHFLSRRMLLVGEQRQQQGDSEEQQRMWLRLESEAVCCVLRLLCHATAECTPTLRRALIEAGLLDAASELLHLLHRQQSADGPLPAQPPPPPGAAQGARGASPDTYRVATQKDTSRMFFG